MEPAAVAWELVAKIVAALDAVAELAGVVVFVALAGVPMPHFDFAGSDSDLRAS